MSKWRFSVSANEQRQRANQGAQYEGGELKRRPPAKPVCGETNAEGEPCMKDANHKGKC